MPKLINPPMTPAKMTSSGKSAPRLMRIGRRTLSMTPTITDQTRSNVPGSTCPDQYTQTTAGTSTGTGPSCAMHKTKMSAVSSPA